MVYIFNPNLLLIHRRRLSMSQEELAKKLNVARYSIINWESERFEPDDDSKDKISQYFKRSIYEFELLFCGARVERYVMGIRGSRYVCSYLRAL